MNDETCGQMTDKNNLKKKVLLLVPLAVIITGLALFLPAGTIYYWQAWAFMAVLFIPFFFVASYFLKKDPKFLERRIRFKEKEAKEKSMIKIAQVLFLMGFLTPGLDFRYGWSQVPVWLAVAADAVIFLSYMFIFLVFRENSYASRIVEVEKGQKVISTGPYSIVRHPMYLGVTLMYLSVPIALGSYLALVFFMPVVLVIFLRILDEERLLLKDLKGYREYCKKVKYRLVPGIW
ncbi:MAG: isoprenylcysteine carboxylmethyltransferase family protein [Candidatus Micrarchaeota archaeon]|nr:isoprenylcysteine carboxylmethyltransferase family protein [Candidatus Micrarchaeota archaeon]